MQHELSSKFICSRLGTYGRDLGPTGEPLESGTMKIDVEAIRDLYESYIIPLTKEVEGKFWVHLPEVCAS